MMSHEITAQVGKHKPRTRRGRGQGSGLGKTCGRGSKGQLSRAGSRPPITMEGGQMPLFRRLPKRGFNNANFSRRFAIINVGQLDHFAEDSRVDAELLVQAGFLRCVDLPLKVLGNGELNHRLTVVAHSFTRSAQQKITSAGGKVELVGKNSPK